MARNITKVLREIVNNATRGHTFDRVLSKVAFVSCGDNECVYSMPVSEAHQNGAGTLHGGVTSTLVDTVSTWLLYAVTGVPGVSVDMNITFMRSVKVHDEILIEARVLKVGQRMAFLTVDLKNRKDGNLFAQGRHTKFMGQTSTTISHNT